MLSEIRREYRKYYYQFLYKLFNLIMNTNNLYVFKRLPSRKSCENVRN